MLSTQGCVFKGWKVRPVLAQKAEQLLQPGDLLSSLCDQRLLQDQALTTNLFFPVDL